MKKNKKLLLAGIGAMSLVAVAVAGVGTAAWYTVGSSSTVTTDETGFSVSSGKSTATVEGLTFTATPGDATYYKSNDESVTASGVILTDNTGKTNYVMNGAKLGANVTPAATDPVYGKVTYTVTASLTSFRAKDGGETDQQYADAKSAALAAALNSLYVNSKTLILTLTAQGYARVAGASSGVYSAAVGSSTVTLTLDFSNSAVHEWTKDVYFSVSPKNDSNTAETTDDHSSDNIAPSFSGTAL